MFVRHFCNDDFIHSAVFSELNEHFLDNFIVSLFSSVVNTFTFFRNNEF